MGWFSKSQSCPICGNSAGGLLSIKLIDKQPLCSECGVKVRIDDISKINAMTVEQAKEYLAFRDRNIQAYQDFKVTREVKFGKFALRVDDEQGIWYCDVKSPLKPPVIFTFEELVDFDYSEDDETVVKKDGIARAVVGGVLLGGVGAVVGAITGTSHEKSTIKKMSVNFTVDNRNIEKLTFNALPSDTKRGSLVYKAVLQEIDKVLFVLNDISQKAQKTREASVAPEETVSATVSVADEILKFKQLLDMGVITQEEFDAKKKQLLGI